MTNEELRVRCAEMMGWTILGRGPGKKATILAQRGPSRKTRLLPDYPNDLNACAELRRALSEDERPLFAKALFDIIYPPNSRAELFLTEVFGIADASAEQICRAFLAAKKGRAE